MGRYGLDYFQKQFEGLPPRALTIIGLRAALRVLPGLAKRRSLDDEPLTFWHESERARYALTNFRFYQVSLFVSSLKIGDAAALFAEEVARDAEVEYATAAFMRTANEGMSDFADVRAALFPVRAALYVADEFARAAAHAIHAVGDATVATAVRAIELDIGLVRCLEPLVPNSIGEAQQTETATLLASPLWPEGEPQELRLLRSQFEADLRCLNMGFEVWIDWYRERLEGNAADWEIERQWALLSPEQLAQSPAEVNCYLGALRSRLQTSQLKRVRAIFIGNGGVGKTSLINVLHGGEAEPPDGATKGVVIKDAIHNQAGVFVRVTNFKEDDLAVHFWDFGGQVMAHATHQFFLRSRCLYVIMLASRAEHNPNDEAEYWLEHVRAFGGSAPVLLVGNKADLMPVSLDLKTLKDKYPNIVEFFSISCTQATGAFRNRFEVFRGEFLARLHALGEQAQRFSIAQFEVLKTIEEQATKDDILSEKGFDEICKANGVPLEGPGGRDGLLDLFDKLGIVMHFGQLPFLTDYVLNPRWLTYGVYTIMYSAEAEAAKGRLTEAQLVASLKKESPSIPNGHAFCYPPDKCRLIADAMIAFRVAYRLGTGELVIPALLAPEQPEHDFKPDSALAFRFDFGGFLPRHILPALVVEYFRDIAKLKGGEVVWQNGVLLRPHRHDAEALVRADYHTRTLDLLVKGSDAPLYLGMLRDSILSTLETMPQLPVREEVELRPDMLIQAIGRGRPDSSVWMPYEIVQTAHRSGDATILGPGGRYDMRRVLAAMPVSPDAQQADVFLSYAHEDGELVESLYSDLEAKHISTWYDAGLIAGQPFRDVLRQRIETVKAVVVLWTQNSVGSKWVGAEADLADHYGKLICLRDPGLDPKRIPMPFAANDHIIEAGKLEALVKALALKGAKPKV